MVLRSLYCYGGHGGAAAAPLRISDNTAEVLTVFGGTTGGSTAKPRRMAVPLWFMSYAVAPRLRCDGGSTTEARRNMLKVSAVPPRRSAVLTVFRGATAINNGTTAELRRSWPYKHRRGTAHSV